MTIHKAKGLEAALVFVAGGRTKGSRSDEVRVFHEEGRRLAWVGTVSAEVKPVVEQEEAEEDQRLMYVALTRAMGRLYLPCVVDATGAARSMRGAYDRVNQRVAALVRESDPLLAVTDVTPPPPARSLAPAPEPPAGAPAWVPPRELLPRPRRAPCVRRAPRGPRAGGRHVVHAAARGAGRDARPRPEREAQGIQ